MALHNVSSLTFGAYITGIPLVNLTYKWLAHPNAALLVPFHLTEATVRRSVFGGLNGPEPSPIIDDWVCLNDLFEKIECEGELIVNSLH